MCGLKENWEKSSIEPEQEKTFLGFILNTQRMYYRADPLKIDSYIYSIEKTFRLSEKRHTY